MFRPKIKLDVFFSARKAVDECWGVVSRKGLIFNEVEGIQGLAPKSVFGGLAPQNHLTMVIILPSPPSPLFHLPSLLD